MLFITKPYNKLGAKCPDVFIFIIVFVFLNLRLAIFPSDAAIFFSPSFSALPLVGGDWIFMARQCPPPILQQPTKTWHWHRRAENGHRPRLLQSKSVPKKPVVGMPGWAWLCGQFPGGRTENCFGCRIGPTNQPTNRPFSPQ
jgi:hypothetical protein